MGKGWCGACADGHLRPDQYALPAQRGSSPENTPISRPEFDILKSFEYPHFRAHCADSVVVITRRCQRLNPGSSPGRRIFSALWIKVLRFSFELVLFPIAWFIRNNTLLTVNNAQMNWALK